MLLYQTALLVGRYFQNALLIQNSHPQAVGEEKWLVWPLPGGVQKECIEGRVLEGCWEKDWRHCLLELRLKSWMFDQTDLKDKKKKDDYILSHI